MEGGRTMDQGPRSLETDFAVAQPRRWWGLRPWKRHSTILSVVGFLFVLIGFGYMFAPPSEMRYRSLKVILDVAPIHVWGGLFVLAGLLSIVSSRWPPLAERWGYMVLTGMSSGWSATFLIGWMFFHSPAGNLIQAVIWGTLGFIWWAISGLPNPERSVGRQ